MVRLAVGMLIVAGCGGGGGAADAPRADAPSVDASADASVDATVDATVDAAEVGPVEEAPDCGGDLLVARGGDLALAVSALRIPGLGESFDLDGDGDPDNKLSAVASLAQSSIDDGLADGTYVLPIEIFDRDADPDGCVKLALYRGDCATASCDMTDGTADTVELDPEWYASDGTPSSRLRAMRTDAAGALTTAGPGYLLVPLPLSEGIPLLIPITVQVVEGQLTGTALVDLELGGIMQPSRLDRVAMPPIPDIGVVPGDTFLDALYANLLGPLLALPMSPHMTGCRTADIDVDDDGLESFCDTDPDDDVHRVDLCIDGDGTVVTDGPGGDPSCTDAVVAGVAQFPDGVSVALELSASPAVIAP
jgi:hypothetical protein